MDAINNKSVIEASLRNRKKKLSRLQLALSKIDNPEQYREEHHLFCIENNLKGRIIISAEGLNGTVSGAPEDAQKYMDYVLGDERFSHTEFKVEPSDEHAFAKLHVRLKPEIVHSSLHHNIII